MDFLRKNVTMLESVPPMGVVSSIGSILLATGVAALVCLRRRQRELELVRLCPRRLVVITGCDSGLGLAMAFWARERGYKLLGGVYSTQSQGANLLRQHFPMEDCHLTQVDVTQKDSLREFRRLCNDILETNKNSLRLWALIPNAAVGLFGEFFWMTEDQGRRIMDVNFWGSVGLTQEFRTLLLSHRSRVIVISSDCADFPLPGLSIYSASKAALENWAAGFRLEVAKYGVIVTSFQPGNFPRQSRLFSGQRHAYDEMKTLMSNEEKNFYGDFFHQYNERILAFSESQATEELRHDENFRKAFLHLLEKDMRFVGVEKRNPAILRLIHTLCRRLPTRASDWIKLRLMGAPLWVDKQYPENHNYVPSP